MSRNFLGGIGEDCVASYVQKKHGWEILGRNVRLRTGEIDIVAKDENTLVFIEVKAGHGNNQELRPEQHVDFRKARKLRTVCREYLVANRYSETTDWRTFSSQHLRNTWTGVCILIPRCKRSLL